MTTTPAGQRQTLIPGATRVGVVGVGRMGANIARRLKDAGYAIAAVADADPGRARQLAGELGA
jgi:3-hydroxyisobutyrate dehydrogenase